MVVVKWTSALAVTLTRSNTVLLNAELRPTLPLIAELRPGLRWLSEDKDVLDMAAAAGCCGEVKLGLPWTDGLVRIGGAMILDGRLWI
jgi:hypothetical protein